MNIWLDDERDPKSEIVQKLFPISAKFDWTWIKTAEECIPLVESGVVERLSFDNDLGAGIMEGKHLANHIEELAFNGKIPKMEWTVHSKNSVAASDINTAMTNADRFWENHEREIRASLFSKFTKQSQTKVKLPKHPYVLKYKFVGGEPITFGGKTPVIINAYTVKQAFSLFYKRYPGRIGELLDRCDVWVEADIKRIQDRIVNEEQQTEYKRKVIDNCWWNNEANTGL